MIVVFNPTNHCSFEHMILSLFWVKNFIALQQVTATHCACSPFDRLLESKLDWRDPDVSFKLQKEQEVATFV